MPHHQPAAAVSRYGGGGVQVTEWGYDTNGTQQINPKPVNPSDVAVMNK